MTISKVYLQITNIKEKVEEINGESFYLCTAKIDNDKIIKIRCSEYQLPEEGNYLVDCFLGSAVYKKKVCTFLDVLAFKKIDKIPEDADNVINVGGVVCGDHEMTTIEQSMSVELKVDLASMSGSKYTKRRRNIVKATLIEGHARKTKVLYDGDILEGSGHLVISKAGNLYVILDKVDQLIRKQA